MKTYFVFFLCSLSTIAAWSQPLFQFNIMSTNTYIDFDGTSLTYVEQKDTLYSTDLNQDQSNSLYQAYLQIKKDSIQPEYSIPSTGDAIYIRFYDNDSVIKTQLRDYYLRSFDLFFHTVNQYLPDSLAHIGYPKHLLNSNDTNTIYLPIFALNLPCDTTIFSGGRLSFNQPKDYLPPYNIEVDSINYCSYIVTYHKKRGKKQELVLWYAEKKGSIWWVNQYDIHQKKYIQQQWIETQPYILLEEELVIQYGYFPTTRRIKYYDLKLKEK